MIGGASLAGGLASATSTWAAAFALTLLSQMLRVLGLSTAWQYVVFGVAIAAGMVISGDRIVGALGMLQRQRSERARVDESARATPSKRGGTSGETERRRSRAAGPAAKEDGTKEALECDPRED